MSTPEATVPLPVILPTPTPTKRRGGFAGMSPEKQRAIASKGGKASHEKKTGHEWSREEARIAGRKGGHRSRGGRGKTEEAPPSAVPASTP